MKIENNFLCLFLSICILSVRLASTTRLSFGEECDGIRECDKEARLSCRDGKCDCSKPNEMVYVQDMKMCLTKSGKRCKYVDGISDLEEITDCVPNSICGVDDVCQCEAKYHEIHNGTCVPSLLFGDTCSEDDQCSKFVGLHCRDSMCECEVGKYFPHRELCIGLSQSDCVRNECVDGAVCALGKCLCDSEHFHSNYKTCLPKKNIFEDCNRDVECLQKDTLKLRCISGKCDCPDKFKYSTVQKFVYSFYNRYQTGGGYKPSAIGFTGPFVEMCAPTLGEKCLDGYCLENAFCDAKSQDLKTTPVSLDICRCIENQYSPNKDHQYCAKTFGQNCVQNSDCIDDLVCSAGKCNCLSPLHQFFERSTRTCITRIGGHCTETSTCVPHSSCMYSSSSNIKGHCRCNTNFVANKDRKCDMAYGAPCNEGYAKCDTVAGLACIDNECSCPDTMYKYDETSRRCLGLVGATCGEDIQCESDCYSKSYACVKNAYCKKEQSHRECDCEDGYTETDDFTCMSNAEIESQAAKVTDSLDHDEPNFTEAEMVRYHRGNCNMYECDNGQCIRNEWNCDGIIHCDDNSDEIGCPEIGKITAAYDNVDVNAKYISWVYAGANTSRWAENCDFIGDTIEERKTTSEMCESECFSRLDCIGFDWTGNEGGTCWLKSRGHPVLTYSRISGICGEIIGRRASYEPSIQLSGFTRKSELACNEYTDIASHYRIVKGGIARKNEFPWMAALFYRLYGEMYSLDFRCGGTIISDYYILTAAHCVDPNPEIAQLGTHILNGASKMNMLVKNCIRHEHFLYEAFKNDIAVVELQQRITFDNRILPACLMANSDDLPSNKELIVTGWGLTEDGRISEILRKTTLRTANLSSCQAGYLRRGAKQRYRINESQYCAVDPDGIRDICRGDSGGPLQIFGDSPLATIVGILSFANGSNCPSSLPGIYTRVSFYLDWIEAKVWDD